MRRVTPINRRDTAFLMAVVLLAAVLAPSPAHAADVPPWLTAAAATPPASGNTSSGAVVLLDETVVRVAEDGVLRTQRRYVARLTSPDGRDAASLAHVYATGSGRIVRLTGWLLAPHGAAQTIDERTAIDVPAAVGDVYNEYRRRVLSAGSVEIGNVFAAEVIAEDRAIFAQLEWLPQGRWPVRQAQYTVLLPPAWRLQATMLNHPAVSGVVRGRETTWALHELPAIPEEASAPARGRLAARLAITLRPPLGSPLRETSFSSWEAISAWLAALSDPAAAVDETLAKAARELTRDTSTPRDALRAIATWVQRVPYASIQMGIGRGGGYRPRPARQVLERQHGDCKDKAALMRALLAAVGISAFPVAVFAGDREYVQPGWPSPQQFNHVILAIRLAPSERKDWASLEHPVFGPLLFFDPTNPHVRLGALPGHEEGGQALLIVPQRGTLLRLPVSSPVNHASVRLTEGTLGSDGTFSGSVTRRCQGDAAALERALRAGLSAADYQTMVGESVAAVMPGAVVGPVAVVDTDEYIETRHRVVTPGHPQMVRNDVLIITPPFRSVERVAGLTETRRTLPVVLEGLAVTELLRLQIPDSFVVEEWPDAQALDSRFGRYRLRRHREGATFTVERQFLLNRAIWPAAEYDALRAFVESARTADGSPIVLRRLAGDR